MLDFELAEVTKSYLTKQFRIDVYNVYFIIDFDVYSVYNHEEVRERCNIQQEISKRPFLKTDGN